MLRAGGVDGHSHSWLDAEEIAQLCAWADDRADEHNKVENNPYWYPELDWGYGYLFSSGWDAFFKYPNREHTSIPPEIQDIRWVFWFDN